ncbi:D-methionine ABC transporter, ATP-binding protein [Myxococcus xanthus DK 1622]|uniref:Methionine import ATP-binding protein MetN n=1 Tax=Myxococcus xanthus (strain DK1622) TaxID=246197 RepID=METN_MYXXD|nr:MULTISPECIES: ATP-binding cassette domain-containing protein [Myxococcus]Q1DDP4.1 RecName: Full=Methionine import ATP-binding protein MetN [Myxococcus xanthus DK 1622]ABF92093.1 D-methionine ABC transporter, ATP-binding protein [Myxococcus xanthus DK 1622]NOJ52118.1 ATP-binding cassette domain-containing protein [Myxococcus xanthus]QPM80628.1 ATP-binding cassette domain-containing protein [Myxococcus xanthus]QVW69689.1 ATP-binding cassette domain-containing protein [Myxococcus xanthus DZ2]
MIAFRGVSKVYTAGGREVAALRNVSLRVEAGEIHGVLGQSGAGKSTLIRCANLLERPTEGSVSVDGQDLLALSPEALRKARQGIGMIFQHFNLFGSKTVAANVAYPLEVAGTPREAIRERVEELLSLVGLSDKAQAYPSQLSGGQKQRVGIARALAPRPRVLLSDEATSALDPETTRSVLGLLRDINQKLGVTLLLITHQMDVVKAICDSVSVLERGRLVEQGKVTELLAHPSTRLHQLCFPAFAAPTDAPSGRRVALTLAGEHARRPLLGTLARQFDVDALLVEGAMERVGNTRVGRLLVDLQGSADAVSQALAYLREQGLTLEEAANG